MKLIYVKSHIHNLVRNYFYAKSRSLSKDIPVSLNGSELSVKNRAAKLSLAECLSHGRQAIGS